ncbi:MAG: glycine zipper 2TM domain-containing protein [Rickettsiales bacterium]|jgi:outer membrane lipoprotein SlyB|nr:glycine zipper 2TM domain-containing protein [Rickettsiales bacterium]
MKKFLMIPVLLLTLGACASNLEADRYETSAAGKVNTVAEGVIMNVRAVTVATSDGTVGKLAGGIAGGAAGSMIGGNSAVNVIGAVGGAVLGGYLGDKAQQSLSKQTGYEYIVKLDSGKSITLTQGTDEKLSVGQKVYVLDANYGDRARIIPR